jgi:hypothetical protein
MDARTLAVIWNAAVIFVGAFIAVIGLVTGLTAQPGDSAPRQTVAALWMIEGLLGLLISAVGIVGATIATGRVISATISPDAADHPSDHHQSNKPKPTLDAESLRSDLSLRGYTIRRFVFGSGCKVSSPNGDRQQFAKEQDFLVWAIAELQKK